MTDEPIPVDDYWPEPYALEVGALQEAKSEHPFMYAAVELTKEFGMLSVLLASIMKDEPPSRDDAILRGMSIRISKLLLRSVAEAAEHRGELQLSLDRMIFESSVDMAYLMQGDAKRYQSYVLSGMIADRELWSTIHANVEAQGGAPSPIERRMLASLESKFGLAQVTPDEIVGRRRSGWPTFEQRLRAIDWDEAYLMYRMGSHSIHGTWNELVTHHLADGDQFTPKPEWSMPRPQPLFATIIITGDVMKLYANHRGSFVADEFEPRFQAVIDRTYQADQLHEAFLAREQTA